MSSEMVHVSLLHPMGYQATKGGEVIRYAAGIQEMPRAHAEAMGLAHRIRESGSPSGSVSGQQPTAISQQPYGGLFDDKLTTILQAGGITSLAQLATLPEDRLRAVKGIGPANFEQIQAALGRRPETQEGE